MCACMCVCACCMCVCVCVCAHSCGNLNCDFIHYGDEVDFFLYGASCFDFLHGH